MSVVWGILPGMDEEQSMIVGELRERVRDVELSTFLRAPQPGSPVLADTALSCRVESA